MTAVDVAAVVGLHKERQAKATIVLTPVDNPSAYGLVETDARRLGAPLPREALPRRDHLRHHQRRHLRARAATPSIAFPRTRPYPSSAATSRRWSSGSETFVAYVERGYWIDIGTPEKYAACTATSSTAAARWGRPASPRGQPVVAADARVEAGAVLEGPCFVDAGAVVKAGARMSAYSVIGRNVMVEEDARVTGAIVWPNTRIGRDAVVDGAIIGRSCHVGRNARVGPRAILGDKTALTDFTHASTPAVKPAAHDQPEIFKAYDVRGLYPAEVNEDIFQLLGRAFAAFLGPGRVAVTRDMRLSSPSLMAAFVDGVTMQGIDVLDTGLAATDMMYYAVASAGLDGGAQITASHNPKQYNGCKLVRRDAFPLSGESGIREMREMMMTGTLPPPAAHARHRRAAGRDGALRGARDGLHRPGVIQPFRVVLDAGSGMAGAVAPHLFDRLPCQTTKLCFEVDGTFPNHEANPLIDENRADIVAEVVRQSADIGIAWDGDADRCFFIDGSGEFIAGDFITALLAEAFLMRQPGATIIYDVRASYAVKDTVARYNGRALMNRVGHAFIKRRMREEDAIFGGEVTGHYYFKDNFYADNGFIPALLILELMSRKGRSLRDLLAAFRERYFISGEINTKVASMDVVPEKLARLDREYRHGHVYRLDGISVEFDDWHFNVRASNTEPLLRLNLEGITPELMERRRDEVLDIIRG